MDQFLCAPVFIGSKTKVVNVVICITDSFLVFFSAQGLLEGKSVNEIKEKLQQGYTTAVLANYKVIMQIVNHVMYTPTYIRLHTIAMASSSARQFLCCSPLLSFGCNQFGFNRMERLLVQCESTLLFFLDITICNSDRKGQHHFPIVNSMTCFERRPKNMIDYVILKVYGAFGM